MNPKFKRLSYSEQIRIIIISRWDLRFCFEAGFDEAERMSSIYSVNAVFEVLADVNVKIDEEFRRMDECL